MTHIRSILQQERDKRDQQVDGKETKQERKTPFDLFPSGMFAAPAPASVRSWSGFLLIITLLLSHRLVILKSQI